MSDNRTDFFHTAIKNSFPKATDVSHPESCVAGKPIFLVDSPRRGQVICKFVDSQIAMRDKKISEHLVNKGFSIPKINISGYSAQWYEIYKYNPNKTLKQHIKNFLDDDKIFDTYKQTLDFQAKLSECNLDEIYYPFCKYFSDIYKITAPTARPKILTNIYSVMIKMLSRYHNVRLVHCDLHPGNIICKDDGSLDQIIDVTGIALASEEFAMTSLLKDFPLPDMSEELMDYYDKITHRKLDRKFIRAGLKLIDKKRRIQRTLRDIKEYIL